MKGAYLLEEEAAWGGGGELGEAAPRGPHVSRAGMAGLLPVPHVRRTPGALGNHSTTVLSILSELSGQITFPRSQGLLAGKDYALLTTADRLGMEAHTSSSPKKMLSLSAYFVPFGDAMAKKPQIPDRKQLPIHYSTPPFSLDF